MLSDSYACAIENQNTVPFKV